MGIMMNLLAGKVPTIRYRPMAVAGSDLFTDLKFNTWPMIGYQRWAYLHDTTQNPISACDDTYLTRPGV